MDWTVDQILALAPDEKSAAAGKKLASPAPWRNTGQDQRALWGECLGSARYQVRVDRADFGYRCTCPSRKLPCKHVLGLLLLSVNSPAAVPRSDPPQWIVEWLAQREARARNREEKQAQPAAKPVDAAAQARRAEQRQNRVLHGLDRLDLWLADIVRNGLAGLEHQPPSFWEEPARRLVDSQAPALAARLRKLGELPGASTRWPQKMLGELGRLALLTHAYRRLDRLSPPVQADLRQMVGWTLHQDEVVAQGEKVTDRWFILGQRVEDEERIRVQRSWLLGQSSARTAVVLQFSAAGQPFPEPIVPGVVVEAELVYWPSAFPQRAKLLSRRGEASRVAGRLPGAVSIDEFLDAAAGALAEHVWLDRILCVLRDVVPVPGDPAAWQIRDVRGAALPLARREHWRLLALSGGAGVDLAGEWNGEELLPLGVAVDGRYYLLDSPG